MEDRLKKALEFSNYRQTLNNQLTALKIKSENQLTISKNGGSFDINFDLISFFDLLVRTERTEAVIIDKNGTPIKVTDVEDMFDDIMSRYFEVANDYLNEYETIRKSRSVKSIVDLETDE